MRSAYRTAAASMLRVKAALVAASPFAAYAAEQTIHRLSTEAISPWTWLFIAGFALLGWVVSELDKVAELWNLEGRALHERVKARLVFVKSLAAALLAGVIAFFLGKLAPAWLLGAMGVKADAPPEIPEMALLLGAAFAGYMGARWFAWLELKLTGKSPQA